MNIYNILHFSLVGAVISRAVNFEKNWEKAMEVSVERHVEQVIDGTDYRGYIKIANTKLDYELKFSTPIPHLGDTKSPGDGEEVRSIIQLTVKRNGADIKLTDEEYIFFFEMIVRWAVCFYYNPQTRDSNGGLAGMILRGQVPSLGRASIGMVSIGSCNFQFELCKALSAPKFGCNLVD